MQGSAVTPTCIHPVFEGKIFYHSYSLIIIHGPQLLPLVPPFRIAIFAKSMYSKEKRKQGSLLRVYVDADASPVKEIVLEETEKRGVPVTFVSSFSHYSFEELPPHAERVYVDSGADSADFRIVQLVKKGDVVVTQDYGLASLALNKGCVVLHHKGQRYTHENIDRLLASRYHSAMARKSGQRTKGPKAMTQEDRENFRKTFREVLDI